MINFIKIAYNKLLDKLYENRDRPSDLEEKLAHKIFISSTSTATLLLLVFAVLYAFNGFYMASVLQLCLAGVCALALYLFRKNRTIVICGNIVFSMIFFAAWYRVHIFGGISAPTFYTFVIIPAFTLGFLPVRWALIWSSCFVAVAVGYHILKLYGINLPSSIPEGKEDALRISGILFANIACFIIFYLLRQVHQSFQNMIENEKEEKANMIRLISHDLSGPLMIMQFHLRKLNSENNSKNTSVSLEKITFAMNAIHALIDNIRHFEAIGSGKHTLKKEVVRLQTVFETVLLIQQESLKNKNVKLIFKGNTDVQVLADGSALTYQVMNNVISNAIKFSDPGTEVIVSTEVVNDWVVIKVKDQGIGIPEKLIHKIAKFNMATNRVGTSGEKGTGFGMPIVKTTMDKLGGHIAIVSKERKAPDEIGSAQSAVDLSGSQPIVKLESVQENIDSGTTVVMELKKAV